MFKLNIKRLFNNGFKFNTTSKMYSKVFDKIVKLSEDAKRREIKLPAYDCNFTIYFDTNEKLLDLRQKILGSDEKILKVEFCDYEDKLIENLDINIIDLIKSPFTVKINNHNRVKYFPSLNLTIRDHDDKSNDHSILDNYNFYIYNTISSGNSSILGSDKLTQIKEETFKKLNILLKIYEDIEKEYAKAEEILNKRYEGKKKLYTDLGLLFFIIHTIVFYVLIYQLYGWDTIEPVTYIVGNVYWIIGLLFFIYKKKKLDFSFFHSLNFRKKFFDRHAKNLGYSEIEQSFVKNEILEINKLKMAIDKF